ncbi:MAG: amidase domain-containing protein [Clostridiales bacterium]|jgi:hypothetical protein|nr:amidase domain-containing protein [Clostridiales bacterium]
MNIYPYDRDAAVAYAHDMAFKRNKDYYDFSEIGGDCTNFVSQCLYAGTGVMNGASDGWYYYGLNNRSPSWTSVTYLYKFLTSNKGSGPFGHAGTIEELSEGDIVQLKLAEADFSHSLLVVDVGRPLGLGSVLIAAHSIDSDYRPLSTYTISDKRFIIIDGYRK